MSLILSAPSREAGASLPPEGAHDATIYEVRDLGLVETRYGPRHRVRIGWTLCEAPPAGSRWPTWRAWQTFNATLRDGSELWKFIRQLTGAAPGESFDLETLVGHKATLVLAHDESGGQIYCNIRAILPAGGVSCR